MPLQRDFLMRMIERFAAAFFQIVAGKKTDAPEQAQLDIEDLLAEALGTSRDFALGLGPAAIDTVEPALAGELARLLLLHAEISDGLGQPSRAARARRMGFRAIERALDRPGTEFATLGASQLRTHFDAIAAVIAESSLHAACVNSHRAAEARRDWADAEDWLFFALDLRSDEDLIAQGRAFYDRLAALPPEDLESGGLTHVEVSESLAELDS